MQQLKYFRINSLDIFFDNNTDVTKDDQMFIVCLKSHSNFPHRSGQE